MTERPLSTGTLVLTLMCPLGDLAVWTGGSPGSPIHLRTRCGSSSGTVVLSVSSTDLDLGDPVFEVSGGISIKVSADTDLDPWTLRLPHVMLIGRQGSAGETHVG